MELKVDNPTVTETCAFFKPKKRSANVRKRDRSDDEISTQDDSPSAVIVGQKGGKKANIFTSKKETADEDKLVQYKASGTAMSLISADQGATKTIDTETDFSQDGVALAEQAKKLGEESRNSNENIYRGMKAYTQYIEKRESNTIKGMAGVKAGPVRASQHIRLSCRFDYQPDICKDYKETGYCGYGDNCKFMHDRGDYKAGWQLDKEWDEQQKLKQSGKLIEENFEVKEEEELPFACIICREPFVNPIITKCSHYFCEKCALAHHSKSKRCFACNEQTFGIFNVAHKLIAKLKQKQKIADTEGSEKSSEDSVPDA